MTDNLLVEAVAQAIWDDCHGWFDAALHIGPDDLPLTATAALRAIKDAGYRVVKEEEE